MAKTRKELEEEIDSIKKFISQVKSEINNTDVYSGGIDYHSSGAFSCPMPSRYSVKELTELNHKKIELLAKHLNIEFTETKATKSELVIKKISK